MFHLQKETIALLEDLECRLDTATEEDYNAQWESFLYNRFDGDIFSLPNRPHHRKRVVR